MSFTVPVLQRFSDRIDLLRAVAPRVMASAAVRIEETLRADSKSKRGNVPSYGRFGAVPIIAVASDTEIRVTAAGWVIQKARDLGQPSKWAGIVIDRFDAAIGGP